LPGDPTPEEQAELLKQAKQKKENDDNDYARKVLSDFNKKGLGG
jgi:hypothetical protein